MLVSGELYIIILLLLFTHAQVWAAELSHRSLDVDPEAAVDDDGPRRPINSTGRLESPTASASSPHHVAHNNHKMTTTTSGIKKSSLSSPPKTVTSAAAGARRGGGSGAEEGAPGFDSLSEAAWLKLFRWITSRVLDGYNEHPSTVPTPAANGCGHVGPHQQHQQQQQELAASVAGQADEREAGGVDDSANCDVNVIASSDDVDGSGGGCDRDNNKVAADAN